MQTPKVCEQRRIDKYTIQVRTKMNKIDRTLLKLEQYRKWVDRILLKLEIPFRSYSLEKKLTLSRLKIVNLILRKCSNYQEVGRPYTVEVRIKINIARSYTVKW